MDTKPLEIGDIVRLKSGSPLMTVTDVSTGVPETVGVAWFAIGMINRERFRPDALVREKEEPS